MVHIHLRSQDVVETRFAFSPMWEVVKSYSVLQNPAKHALYIRWVREAERAVRGADLRYVDALIGPNVTDYAPDFLTPASESHGPAFDDELRRMRETPPDMVRRDVRTMLEWREVEDDEERAVVRHFLEDPSAAMDRLIEALQTYWQRTLAHHWPRIQTVLEGDVLRRSRQLAMDGPEALFNDLHRLVAYEDGTICVDKHFRAELAPEGRGLTLVPVLFSWPDVYLIVELPRRPVIGYSPHGAGLWKGEPKAPAEALVQVMGEARAAVLMALVTPSTTGEIADRLDRTDGAVSQQLSRLKEAGLAEGLRQGRYKYYRLTERGEALIDVFSPA